jgi:hypothetical protein
LTGAAETGAGRTGSFSRAARRTAAAIALVAAMFSIASLRRYGVTIDEPALFYAGDRTLFALGHPGQPGALDFGAPEPPGFHSHFPRLPEPDDPERYPVLPGLFAAATDATVGRAFGLGPVDGHHAGLAILSIALLALFALYACRLLGDRAGGAAAIALACFPTIVGHAFNDPKDWPCAGFYALTVLAAGVGLVERRPRQLWLAGLFFGLALSCKQNAIFAAVTVALATPFFYRLLYRDQPDDRPRPRPRRHRIAAPLLLLPYVGGVIFFVAWPWLWWGGVSAIGERVGNFVGFARTFSWSARAGFSAHPFRCLALMTPPLVLVAAGIGCWPGRAPSRARLAIGALLAIWLFLPLARIALPHASFYDANRHFIEYIPALCALAGLGFAETWARIAPRLRARLGARGARAAGGAALAVAGVALLWPVAAYHPFETAYFNLLTGGLGGAQRRALFFDRTPATMVNGTEGDYWLSSLREGVRAAQAAAPPGRPIGICAWLPALAAVDSDGPLPEVTAAVEGVDVPVVYASPREPRCSWKRLHELERWRPVVSRVTRGGGLIYEILGPREPAPHEPVSPATLYDR